MHKIIFLMAVFTIFPLTVFCSDYEECIAEKMKDAHSGTAAKMLAGVCYNLTIPKACRDKDLTEYKKLVSEKKWVKHKDVILRTMIKIKELEVKEKAYVYIPNDKENFGNAPARMISMHEYNIKKLTEATHDEALALCFEICENASFISKNFGECSNDW